MSPPPRPANDDEIRILDDEQGRFRCVRRKDSHIDTVVWEYETASAEETYAGRRSEDAQRDQFANMEREEIQAELEGRSDLTELTWREISKTYFECCENAESDQATINPIEYKLVQTIADREGPRAALTEYRELMSEER